MNEKIKQELLFKPSNDNFYLNNGEVTPTRYIYPYAGKIRLVYKNKLVLTLPYFFQVICRQYPAIWYYDEELEEYAPVYRKIKDKYYYFYLNALGRPMFQQYRLSIEEGMLSEDVNLPHRFHKTYKKHNYVLSFLDHKLLHYAFYKEGYKRMEQIAQNIENDLPYYQNISDITLEISEIIEYNEMPALYEKSKTINDKRAGFPYDEKMPYGIGLEEWKNLLIKYFGESNSNGWLGMDENYFKDFTYHTELWYFVFWLYKSNYIFDERFVPEEERKYYAFFFVDKRYLDNYKLPSGRRTFRIGGDLDHVWVQFIRRLFWRRLKVISKLF